MSTTQGPSVNGGKEACLVIGAGDDTGGAIGRAFAQEGMISCLVRRPRHADALEALAQSIRDEGKQAVALPADARDEDEMIALIERIEAEIAPIEVAVFNIGANVQFPVTETTGRVYRKVWEMACFAGFDGANLLERTQDPAVKARLVANTEAAVARGAFGVPTFYVGDEMFFGKDRLAQVEDELGTQG